MDYQQKAAALFALGGDPSICMRNIGDWYVNQDVSIRDGDVLVGSYGNGASPADAILDHWRLLVDELKPDQYLVTRDRYGERCAVRWNGFMWAKVFEKNAA